MSVTQIYIAGSITDGGTITDPAVIATRQQEFYLAERKLVSAGYGPINPMRREVEPDKTWLAYMRDSLRDIAEADGVALLPGWELSRGARLERNLAVDLGLSVGTLVHWLEGDA